MPKEETIKHFTSAIISLAEVLPCLDDDFFSTKLRNKMEKLTSRYLGLETKEEDSSVAQYYHIQKLIFDSDDIIELLEIINYLGKTKKTTPLLLARRTLLSLKLELLRIKNSLASSLKKKESSVLISTAKLSDNNQISGKSSVPINRKNANQNLELNPNKEKILNFIKKSPNIRTKDIIHEFSAISDRTVKRNLGELLRVGLINKKIENKAVYYSAEIKI